MKLSDRALGMHRAITRRDFVNGLTVATAASLISVPWRHALSASDAPATAVDTYPPRRTGLRGSHPGSFEVAHRLRDQHGWTSQVPRTRAKSTTSSWSAAESAVCPPRTFS